ncbi:hypothetical protein AB0F03_37760 [Streptomyces sp. NPDC028722]|uniref:hypothetical protein n=1 Tax=Streptomyces sp. NPDC028722 TaxID=3155016 RepID=UPI0033C31785
MLDVGEDIVTLSAAGTVFEFAPEAEAVLWGGRRHQPRGLSDHRSKADQDPSM